MTTQSGFQPDYADPPGHYLGILLHQMSMSQADLAARTGLSAKHINQVIKRRVPLSPETATQLEFVTDVPAEIWAGLDARYQAQQARSRAAERFTHSLEWLDRFNLTELAKRGVITTASRTVTTMQELLRYFGIADPDGWDRVWRPSLTSFRRSPAFTPDATATTIWLRAAQRKAAAMDTAPYDQRALRDSLADLRALTALEPPAALSKIRDRLATHGVALVLVAEFDGCRASGATWWSGPEKAVVVLSNRGKREDRLWFSLFHELGHVVHHAKRDTFIDQSPTEGECPPWSDDPPASALIDDGSRDSVLEQEADKFASEALVPATWANTVSAVRTKSDVRELADHIGVCAGVVAGRYQFVTGDYRKFNDLRRPVPHDLFV